MIEVRTGELADAGEAALLRPVDAGWSAVTPATRRLELAAGPALAEQCRRLGELPVGSAAITGAGVLRAEFMVHVVVRSAEEPVTPAGVRRALVNGLRRLTEWGIESVAMPPLGTGAGNLDAEESARIMVPAILEHQRGPARPLRVAIVVESEYELEAFRRVVAGSSPRRG
ncbi:MAG TPA: macro domain-containing protein [Longimicrobiales bacterium]